MLSVNLNIDEQADSKPSIRATDSSSSVHSRKAWSEQTTVQQLNDGAPVASSEKIVFSPIEPVLNAYEKDVVALEPMTPVFPHAEVDRYEHLGPNRESKAVTPSGTPGIYDRLGDDFTTSNKPNVAVGVVANEEPGHYNHLSPNRDSKRLKMDTEPGIYNTLGEAPRKISPAHIEVALDEPSQYDRLSPHRESKKFEQSSEPDLYNVLSPSRRVSSEESTEQVIAGADAAVSTYNRLKQTETTVKEPATTEYSHLEWGASSTMQPPGTYNDMPRLHSIHNYEDIDARPIQKAPIAKPRARDDVYEYTPLGPPPSVTNYSKVDKLRKDTQVDVKLPSQINDSMQHSYENTPASGYDHAHGDVGTRDRSEVEGESPDVYQSTVPTTFNAPPISTVHSGWEVPVMPYTPSFKSTGITLGSYAHGGDDANQFEV